MSGAAAVVRCPWCVDGLLDIDDHDCELGALKRICEPSRRVSSG